MQCLNTVLAYEIAVLLRAKACARSKPLKLTAFASSPDSDHRERGAEQVHLVLRASLAVAKCSEKNPRMRKCFIWSSAQQKVLKL